MLEQRLQFAHATLSPAQLVDNFQTHRTSQCLHDACPRLELFSLHDRMLYNIVAQQCNIKTTRKRKDARVEEWMC